MNPVSSNPVRGYAVAAFATLSMALAGNGWAQDHSPHSVARARLASVSAVELERSFWVCDYVATARGVSEDLVVACAAVYDELKDRQFGGDFDRLWAWWQKHKAARHAQLDVELPQQ